MGKGTGTAVGLGVLLLAVTFAVQFALWFGSCVTGCAGQDLRWIFLAWLAPVAYVLLVARRRPDRSLRSSAARAALASFALLIGFVAFVFLVT